MAQNSTIANSSTNNEKETNMPTSSKDATASSCANIVQNFCQNRVLIWLDSSIDESNQDFCNSLAILGRISNRIEKYSNPDECKKFLDQVQKNEKVFMIVSGRLGEDILPKIHSMPQLKSVFVFCSNISFHKQWARKYKKVEGVYNDIAPICNALHLAARQCDQNSVPVSFFSVSPESNQTLSQLDYSFMCIQVLRENILRTKDGANDPEDFAQYCRDQHINDSEINDFRKTYLNRDNEWYNSECFIFPMLNWALRNLAVDAILKMGFLIRDLDQKIKNINTKEQNNSKKTFNVYQVQGLSTADFEELDKNKHGFMSFDNFMFANTNENDCIKAARDAKEDSDIKRIVFAISIDPKIFTNSFAATSPSADEFLFSLHSVFRINSIKKVGNDKIWKVKLTLTSDDENELAVTTKRIRDETWGLAGWDRLSELLFKFGKFDKAKEVYNVLLNRESSDDEKALLYQQLGRIERQQGDNDSAIKSYERACEIFKKTSKDAELADSYNNIGLAYEDKGQYPEALKYHQQALEIRKEVLSPDHPKVANSHNNLGNVHNAMEQYSDARSSHKEALKIRKKSLPPNHPNLANSYNNLGLVYFNEKDYAKALMNHQKALEIRKSAHPPNNPSLAGSYNNIGLVNERMGDFASARSNFEEAIKTAKRSLSSNHSNLLMYEENYERVKNSCLACNHDDE